MKIKNIIFLAGVLFVAVFLISQIDPKNVTVGSAPEYEEIRGIATMASSTVTTASTLIMATSTSGEVYRAIVNDGATDVYLGIGTAAVSGKGIRLNSGGGSFEMVGDTLFTAAIYGISSASVNVTTITK